MDSSLPFVAIVDDVSDNVRILHHCLRDEGYRFGIARNAAELFLLLESQKPTVILLDIMLPDMDGFTILENLRKDERFMHIPVIFVSARAEVEDIIHGFELGGVDYITKPFNSAEVRARVKTHIRLHVALQREKQLNAELSAALERVRTLEGIIPICANCKSVRSDRGYWTQVESYLSEHTGALFTHSLCPDCAAQLFPDAFEEGEADTDASPPPPPAPAKGASLAGDSGPTGRAPQGGAASAAGFPGHGH